MISSEKQRIIDRYNNRLQQFGPTIEALASGSEERRRIRFDAALSVGVATGCSLLDLGCGFGDLLGYLRMLDLDVDYTGIDINPDLLSIAQQRFPDARFLCRDIQIETVERHDYVVAISAFNLALDSQDNYEFAADILRRSFDVCNRGISIDFMSSYVDYTVNDVYYYQPEKIFSIAKSICPRVKLRHDYLPHDFCIQLLR